MSIFDSAFMTSFVRMKSFMRFAFLALVLVMVALVSALTAMRFVTTSLYGVKTTDPGTIGTAVAVIALVALIAGYVPARRAAAVDPQQALRQD